MAIHILVPLKYMTTNLFIHLMDLIFPHYEHLKKLNSILQFFPFLMQLYPSFISLIFVVIFFLVNYTFEKSLKGVSGQYQPQKVGR